MSETKKLQGKVAVLTGGTTGIGLAAAKLFVREGAYVFIMGRRQKEVDAAVKVIGSNVTGVQGDVVRLDDLDRLYEAVKAKGKLDIVFANAGVAEFAPLGKITEEHFDKLFDINVKGTLFTVQKALPLMNDGGSIILNGSVASVNSTFGDLTIIWARDEADSQVKGFIVENKTTPGFKVEKIQHKMALRVVQNGLITLENCRVPEENRLQNDTSFRDTARVLRMTRGFVAWEATGCQMGAYENALLYAQTREQFGNHCSLATTGPGPINFIDVHPQPGRNLNFWTM